MNKEHNYIYLDKIHSPTDVKKMPADDLPILAGEVREQLIDTVSHNGGHLASNLGVVELTIALHRVFDSPDDQFVWDVGHQVYTHKLLTGRLDDFDTLRQEDGISGFSRPYESKHDIFSSGHSSTSISAAHGLAMAKHLMNDQHHAIAIIGDGALTGGLAYEALNNAGRSKENLIVILNNNDMSISKNVGAVARHLAVVRSHTSYTKFKSGVDKFVKKIPLMGKILSKLLTRVKTKAKESIYGNTIFEDMGFRYMGPIDGHDMPLLIQALESAKMQKRPVLLHINTIKGKGYDLAEINPSQYHGISKFDINTGDPISSGENFSEVFGHHLVKLAEEDGRICAISAAMSIGTGLKDFFATFPERSFDVGIAEGHAVTFSSGLSKNGMIPVFAVYSTFLQRCYDQLIHDVAMQNLKLILAVDRAGFVGEDGESHQGIFDIPIVASMPNTTIYSPTTYQELKNYLEYSLYDIPNMVAIRYPRGSERKLPEDFKTSFGNYDLYGNESALTVIVTYGRITADACEAAKILYSEHQKEIKVLKLNRIHPIDISCIEKIKNAKEIYFFEESIQSGSIAERFAALLSSVGYNGKYHIAAVPNEFVRHASVASQLAHYHLDKEGMLKTILEGENHE